MRIIVCENYEEVSKKAAQMILSQVTLKPNSVLGLATGSTPIGMYENLVSLNKKGDIDFSEVRTFNLDEYYKLPKENDQSYHYGFDKQEKGYAYELYYYPGKQEYFIWKMNVPVTQFDLVQLIYTLQLANPQKEAGNYGFYDEDGHLNKDNLKMYTIIHIIHLLLLVDL